MDLFGCKLFHNFRKVLLAIKVSAHIIGLVANRSSLAYRWGKEITLFLIIFNTIVDLMLFNCCFHIYLQVN